MNRLAYHMVDKFTKYSDKKEIVKSRPKYDDLWERCFELEVFYEKMQNLFTNVLFECDEYECCGFYGKSKKELLGMFNIGEN